MVGWVGGWGHEWVAGWVSGLVGVDCHLTLRYSLFSPLVLQLYFYRTALFPVAPSPPRYCYSNSSVDDMDMALTYSLLSTAANVYSTMLLQKTTTSKDREAAVRAK